MTAKRRRGRPPWAPFGEPTRVMRVPQSQVERIRDYLDHLRQARSGDAGNIGQALPAAEILAPRELPFVQSPAPQAGQSTPLGDVVEEAADLHQMLVRNPAQSFLVRVQGESMIDALIFDQDLLVVDRSIEPSSGRIVVATWDGDLYVKRLRQRDGVPCLVSENEERAADYPDMPLDGRVEARLWGCVTGGVRRY